MAADHNDNPMEVMTVSGDKVPRVSHSLTKWESFPVADNSLTRREQFAAIISHSDLSPPQYNSQTSLFPPSGAVLSNRFTKHIALNSCLPPTLSEYASPENIADRHDPDGAAHRRFAGGLRNIFFSSAYLPLPVPLPHTLGLLPKLRESLRFHARGTRLWRQHMSR